LLAVLVPKGTVRARRRLNLKPTERETPKSMPRAEVPHIPLVALVPLARSQVDTGHHRANAEKHEHGNATHLGYQRVHCVDESIHHRIRTPISWPGRRHELIAELVCQEMEEACKCSQNVGPGSQALHLDSGATTWGSSLQKRPRHDE
jgi:hypothetical protein